MIARETLLPHSDEETVEVSNERAETVWNTGIAYIQEEINLAIESGDITRADAWKKELRKVDSDNPVDAAEIFDYGQTAINNEGKFPVIAEVPSEL